MSDVLEPNASNLAYAEELYEQWSQDPQSVSETWQKTFQSWEKAMGRPTHIGPSRKSTGLFKSGANASPGGDIALNQHKADILIRNYRSLGHLSAHINPLDPVGLAVLPQELQPEFFGFTSSDLDEIEVDTSTIAGGQSKRTLRSVIEQMQATYSSDIGVQFMHIEDLETRLWLQQRMERSSNKLEISHEQQKRIFARLTDATLLETFILKKFLGAKSFSLEGGETLIPLLDQVLEKAGEANNDEVIIGMAHRGRLNVLANIMGKEPYKIFREFRDCDPEEYMGSGDVKYHLGHSADWKTSTGKNVHLSLCFNPSHLEYVNVVAMGRAHAKMNAKENYRVMPVMIHGDAAFAGEGIVQETLQMSQLNGYSVDGSVHIVINNQVGFTTNPSDSRSTTYCTDIAKMLQSPIFHVNGENPEAVAQAVAVAMDFRERFGRDVFIDMLCYRRRGHNENDEPRFTQPEMYAKIDKLPTVQQSYKKHVLELGKLSEAEAQEIEQNSLKALEDNLAHAEASNAIDKPSSGDGIWESYTGGNQTIASVDFATGIDTETQQSIMNQLASTPEGFTINRKHKRLLETRKTQGAGESPYDWAAAEALAYGSLILNGNPVRISGQDAQRGTFSHRHSMLHDSETGVQWMALNQLEGARAKLQIHNSPLIEAGVLGFEYGYSLDTPNGLTIWEAQFGDFANCAQVIFDQFVFSGEDKWNRLSGLTMLLPHGYEGQGPEHSSARLERFLQLCAEHNMQVCQPTTPAQIFHLLRRQGLSKWRKPLVVMSPKSLLRHPSVQSTQADIENGSFQHIIQDAEANTSKATRILLCSGKIYYDLVEERKENNRDDIAIIRVEQLYPLNKEELEAAVASYPKVKEVAWVQDEPENQGAWTFIFTLCKGQILGKFLESVARPASASPATGSKAAHLIEQKRLMEQAFTNSSTPQKRKKAPAKAHAK